MDYCSEDWCFVCKDGGDLMLCDHEGCTKVYHPKCVGRKKSFLKSKKLWTCSRHCCYVCRNNGSTTSVAISFSCLCCPYALCDPCYTASTSTGAAEFSLLRGKDKSGLCNDCLEVVRLSEENSEDGADGEKLDFENQDSFECRLKEYWEFIKKNEGLTLNDVYSPKDGKRKSLDEFIGGSKPLLQFQNYMKLNAKKLRTSAVGDQGLREMKMESVYDLDST
ncbi:hypothetical protein ACLB2K_059969 [Fragaria x ananassa]